MSVLVNCPHCSTRVLPLAGRICPACRKNVDSPPEPKPIPPKAVDHTDRMWASPARESPAPSFTFRLRRPEAVEGTVIDSSWEKTFHGCAIAGVMLVALLVLCIGFFASRLQAGKINITLALLIVFAVVSLGLLPFLYMGLFRSRIVLGADRLQVVKGKAKVIVQVPYANMAQADDHKNFLGMRVLGINLVNPSDPDSFWGMSNRGNQHHPFHVIISDVYVDPPDMIVSRIAEAHRRWKNGEAPRAV
jgi:hypothetical protein